MTWRGLAIVVVTMMAVAAPAVSEAQCSVSTSGVAFGTYDVLVASPLDTTGTVTFSCLLALLPKISLSTGSSGGFAPRTMKKGGVGEPLAYNLYLNAARTNIWGDGTGGTGLYQPLVVLLGATLTVYGRVPANANVSTGAYSDTVVVTLFF